VDHYYIELALGGILQKVPEDRAASQRLNMC
jgi:hypothetical protein